MNDNFLVINDGTTVEATLSDLALKADKIQIAVAFLSTASPLENWLRRGVDVELIVVLRSPTDASVLRNLVNSYRVHLKAKFYSAAFHSKLFIFFKDGAAFCAQVGSSNATRAGLTTNLETNVLLKQPAQLKELRQC